VNKEKEKKAEKTFRRPWIPREDYTFLLIFIISALLHLSTAIYLSTIEIREMELGEALRAIPRRFARLILQPPPEILKRVARPLPLKKEEAKEEVRKEEEVGLRPAKEAKEEVRKEVGVRAKGLLGVIMAKARPREVPAAAVLREVDKLMKEVKRAEPEERVKEVLSQLRTKEIERVEEITAGIARAPVEIKPRETGEIIKEKREVLLEEVERKRVVPEPLARKKYEEEVYATILSYTGGLRYLYNNALRKDPTLKGRVTVRIVISRNGRAKDVVMVSSTLDSPELEEAIVNRIFMWRFHEFRWGESFTTIYTFDFSPIG
jgi:hypothetical protein